MHVRSADAGHTQVSQMPLYSAPTPSWRAMYASAPSVLAGGPLPIIMRRLQPPNS